MNAIDYQQAAVVIIGLFAAIVTSVDYRRCPEYMRLIRLLEAVTCLYVAGVYLLFAFSAAMMQPVLFRNGTLTRPVIMLLCAYLILDVYLRWRHK